MTTILFIALPIAMLVSAIVGGFLYFKRNLDTEIHSLLKVAESSRNSSPTRTASTSRKHTLTSPWQPHIWHRLVLGATLAKKMPD